MAENLIARCNISGAHAMLFFRRGGSVQKVLHELKYHSNIKAGSLLGKLMGNYLQKANVKIDLVIPVPLHPKKQKLRGYNQCDILAKEISLLIGAESITNAVIRVEHSESQTHMDRFDRWKNSQALFELSDSESLAGCNVLIVDDVFTTGATMESICRTVLKADPKNLFAITAAYAAY